jgi:NADH-quinone oxidoreductase subunit H
MSLNDIVNAQKTIPFLVYQPLAFIIFVLSALAEINRAPFDMPEAEQELTAGYHTEYSSMKFALFFMAEYIKMIGISMIGSTLFLGGCQWPFSSSELGGLMGPIQLLAKTVLSMFVIIWFRATLPRIRYDHLMALGWKVAFPVALLNVVVTAVLVLVLGG